MTANRVFLAVAIVLAGAVSASAQTTLYVNGSTGNDAVSKANNSASNPWRTIGRAAWGSTNRDVPNAAEAAAAGDTVLIAGGTYISLVAVNNRYGVVYNPVNNGTSANPITFTCVGDCVLGAPNANGPVIGSAQKNYIKWYADVGQGHSWQIRAYGRQSGSAAQTEVNTAPDTGPVVCQGGTGCWVEGAHIDGGLQTDYTDNWNGIRVDNCTACVIRNNIIVNFQNQTNSSNSTAVTLYGSANTVVENNFASNVVSGVIFKDTSSTLPQNGIRVRYNMFQGVGVCFVWSVTNEDRNYVYQNVCLNSTHGMAVAGAGLSNDWIFNNTFYNLTYGVVPNSLGFGGRFWNNIVSNTSRVIYSDSATMPPASVLDVEHNLYYAYSQFYSGTDGGKTLAEFRSAFPTQDQAAPLSIDRNPLFVNPAGGDFRLCTGAGVPAPNCGSASPAIGLAIDIGDLDRDGNVGELTRAGAFVTNSEFIGPAGGVPQSPSTAPAAPSNLRIIR